MKYISFCFIIIFSVAFKGISQNIEFKSSNFKDKKEAFKAAEASLDEGNDLYKQAMRLIDDSKDPAVVLRQALTPFLKANEFNPDNSELNYRIGKSMFLLSQKTDALPYLTKAIQLDEKNIEPDAYYLLGQAMKLEYKFKEAKEFIQKYKSLEKPKKLEAVMEGINRELNQCSIAAEMIDKPLSRIWVDNAKEWNTEYDDYGATITADESAILFNSKIPSGVADASGQFAATVLSSIREKGKWSKKKPFGGPFSIPGLFEVSSFSFDGQTLILYKPGLNGEIYISDLEGDKWSIPQALPEKINSIANETQACLSGDRIRLYYITDQAYGNKGGSDIYFSGIMNPKTNIWGQGQTIGSEINTTLDDGYIFLHADDKTLYFASKGHNSMGGYDIFRSERLAGRWSAPENLGYPINTPFDETSFVQSASGKRAYITSNREGGIGGSDIYRITYLGPVKNPLPDIRDQLLADIASPQRDTKLESSVKVESKNLTILRGRVIDDFTGNPVKADIEIVDNQKNEVVMTVNSNSSTGKFLVSLPAGKNYGIAVTAKDYLFHSENFDLPLTSDYQLVEKDIRLKGACIGCKIILRNIFFDTGKFNLRPESFSELNRLVQLINDIARVKPGIKIEISGHTDNVGADASNQLLSENRAKAVVKYLVDNGISQSKLVSKGYGPKEPVSTNSTPEGRQENRRTEFKIIED